MMMMMIRHAPLVECNQSTTIRMILIATTTVPTSAGRRRRTPSIVETNATTCSSSSPSYSLSVSTTHARTHSFTTEHATDHNVRRTQPNSCIHTTAIYIQNTIQYNLHRVYMPESRRRRSNTTHTNSVPHLRPGWHRSILLIPSVENIMTLTR